MILACMLFRIYYEIFLNRRIREIFIFNFSFRFFAFTLCLAHALEVITPFVCTFDALPVSVCVPVRFPLPLARLRQESDSLCEKRDVTLLHG